MMGGTKNKKLIDAALMRIEEECCADGFADKDRIEKIRKSLVNTISRISNVYFFDQSVFEELNKDSPRLVRF